MEYLPIQWTDFCNLFSPYESAIYADDGSVLYFPICQGMLPWPPNSFARMKANWYYMHSLPLPDGSSVSFRYCLLGGDIVAPSGLLARLCHAFLVVFVPYVYWQILSMFYKHRNVALYTKLKLIDRLRATSWTPLGYWQTDNSNGLVMVIRHYHWLNSASRVLILTCSAPLVQTGERKPFSLSKIKVKGQTVQTGQCPQTNGHTRTHRVHVKSVR